MFSNPLLSPISVLIVASALSIGWGIRGNYGHENGAMFPGAIATIAACVLSGREDWRRRVAYFAMFGAIGWGFGGSISYMQVISYTHSGDEPSQLYGFYCLFAIGFLWASLGGGSAGLVASLDLGRLADLVRSFIPLFLVWVGLYLIEYEIVPPPTEWPVLVHESIWPSDTTVSSELSEGKPRGFERDLNSRQNDPYYWLDSDWMQAGCILAGILAVQLVRQRGRGVHLLALLAGSGAMLGTLIQLGLARSGKLAELLHLVVIPQGDTSKYSPSDLITNWPIVFEMIAPHLGWTFGLILGALVYFSLFARFSFGLSLYFHMAVGWFVGFIGLSVLGNLHMTPPRGDSWAGVTGTIAGAWLFLLRHQQWPTLLASVVCGTIGGIGFSGTAWIKILLLSLGNEGLVDAETAAAWKHYHSANWHSFLEQTYGFINGIGVAIALALLVRRVPRHDDESRTRPRWAEVFCFMFALPVLLYVNMAKNLNEWTRTYNGHTPVPKVLHSPLFQNLEMTAWAWFTILFAFASAAILVLAIVQGRQKLAIIPNSWSGRGQLLFFLICWSFVIGNFAKAIVAFQDSRLITEWVIGMHAVVATTMLLIFTRRMDEIEIKEKPRWMTVLLASLVIGGAIAFAFPMGATRHVRQVYADSTKDGYVGHMNRDLRFGEDANWRKKPILRNIPHR